MAGQAQLARESDGRIGVELADLGTRITVALPDAAAGQVERVSRARIERPPTPDEVIERLGALVEAMDTSALSSVGVAVWGRVNPARGEIADAHFDGAWADFPFAERLAARLGAPARLISGVNAAARAEALMPTATGRSPLLYIHLGRTVASALVVNGEPVVGAHDDEGRLGHWQTDLDGPRCVCGARGHLEPLASAQSLVRQAIGVAAHDEDALAAIHRVTGARAEALSAPQLVALARDGVRPLRELVDYALDALAGAVGNLVVTLDPALILIGGPLALADDVFFVWLRERVAARLAGIGAAPEITPARTEPRGALLGAIWA